MWKLGLRHSPLFQGKVYTTVTWKYFNESLSYEIINLYINQIMQIYAERKPYVRKQIVKIHNSEENSHKR